MSFYGNVINYNEVAGEATDTIEVIIDDNNKITANVKEKSITEEKISSELMDEINTPRVIFAYESENKRLKISYINKEENDNGTTV